jgi:hypothetical protein
MPKVNTPSPNPESKKTANTRKTPNIWNIRHIQEPVGATETTRPWNTNHGRNKQTGTAPWGTVAAEPTIPQGVGCKNSAIQYSQTSFEPRALRIWRLGPFDVQNRRNVDIERLEPTLIPEILPLAKVLRSKQKQIKPRKYFKRN